MDQHVLSRWLLAAFAQREHGRYALAGFDKADGSFGSHDPDDFLIEVDAHSAEIELALGRVEGPAAAAARQLHKRTKHLPSGLYALVDPGSQVRSEGSLVDLGVRNEMRLLGTARQIPSPAAGERLAIAQYAGLMYVRAPKTEAAVARFGQEYNRAAQAALDEALPGVKTGLELALSRRRANWPHLAGRIGSMLDAGQWFAVRAPAGKSFVLGDTPVAAALSLGHDEPWRALFAEGSYAVVMPVNPSLALLIATQRIVPVSVEEEDIPAAINRLMWRSADRFVLASRREDLDSAWAGGSEADLRAVLEPAHDGDKIASSAQADVHRIVLDIAHFGLTGRYTGWPAWSDHRPQFGRYRPGIDDAD